MIIYWISYIHLHIIQSNKAFLYTEFAMVLHDIVPIFSGFIQRYLVL